MGNIVFVDILDSEIIDNESERYITGFVGEQTGGRSFIVVVGAKMFHQVLMRYLTRFAKPIPGFLDLDKNKTIVDLIGKVICVDNLDWDL